VSSPPELHGREAERLRERVRRARRRRRLVLVWLVRLVLLGAAFFAGLAVGRAVEDAPKPGGTQTLVRTLVPATVKPEPGTVTVTAPSP